MNDYFLSTGDTMANCHNPESYDRTNQRNKHGYATPAATKERKALKKAARKFSRACERLVIDEQLKDLQITNKEKAEYLAELATEMRWGLEHIIDMWEQYEVLPSSVKTLAQSEYDAFMLDEELYSR